MSEQTPADYVLYGRTSKDDKRRLTIENQQETLAKWRANDRSEGSTILEEWDIGVSGKVPFPERPKGRRIMELVARREGKPLCLVVCYIDRFARDLLSGIQTAKELNRLGTLIVATNEGLDARKEKSPFQFNLRLCFAEEEWFRIHDRMEIGKQRFIDQHNAAPGGVLAFGYRVAKDGTWFKDPMEAPIVLRCFEMILEGYSQHAISAWLRTVEGLATGHRTQKRDASEPSCRPGSGVYDFAPAFVSKLLSNRAYIGERQWGKRSFPVPPIVTLEMWEKVQAVRAERAKRNKAAATREFPALLSGVLTCGTCGGTMHAIKREKEIERLAACRKCPGGGGGGKPGLVGTEGKSAGLKPSLKPRSGTPPAWQGNGLPEEPVRRVYRCQGQRIAGQPCNSRQFVASELDNQLWPLLRDLLENPGDVLRRVVHADRQQSAAVANEEQNLDDLAAQLAELDKEAEEVWELKERNGLPLSFVETQMKRMQAKRETIMRAIEAAREKAREAANAQEKIQEVASALSELRGMAERAETDYALRQRIASVLVKNAVSHTVGRGKWGGVRVAVELRWGEAISAAIGGNAGLPVADAIVPCTGARNPCVLDSLPFSFTVGRSAG